MWGKITELIPSWGSIVQAIMIFGVPFAIIRTNNWARAKEFYSRDNDIRPSVLLYVSKGKA